MKKIFLFLMLVFVSSFSFVQAEEAEVVRCFDYYEFQSVHVSVDPEKNEYQPGDEITFQGEVLNENNYPIVDGYVFVRIAKANSNYRQDGHDVIDEFMAADKIVLDSKERKAIEFYWQIPQMALSGEYKVSYFFSTGKKFNLAGLPFTNEVNGGLSNFVINSEENDSIYFERSETKVNGEPYKHIGNWPLIEPGEGAEIIQPIINTFDSEKDVTVQYELYWWDSLNEKDKLTVKEEKLILPANGKISLNYKVPEMKDSVYYLRITAYAEEQKSIVNIRLTSRIDHLRLNFPALLKFPIKKGEAIDFFSCFHNTNFMEAKGFVKLMLEDSDGNLIGSANYEGNISSNMMAVKNSLKASTDYNWIKMKAEMSDSNGNIKDSYETIYDCNLINLAACQPGGGSVKEQKNISNEWENIIKKAVWGVIFLTVISVIIIIATKARRRWKKNSSIFILFIFSGILVFGFNIKSIEAKSVNSSGNYGIVVSKFYLDEGSTMLEDYGKATITHVVNLLNPDINEIYEKDPINFSYDPEDPSFYSTGGTWDTPYGGWCDKTGKNCSSSELLVTYQGIRTTTDRVMDGDIRTKFYANIIDRNFIKVVSDNEQVISCPGGLNCTALKEGTATISISIPPTIGKAVAQHCVRTKYCVSYEPCGADDYGCPCNEWEWPEEKVCSEEYIGRLLEGANSTFFSASWGWKSLSFWLGLGEEYRNVIAPAKGDYNTIFSVPEKITFTINVKKKSLINDPPVPICPDLSTVEINKAGVFNFNSTDKEKNKIQYGVNWLDGKGVLTSSWYSYPNYTHTLTHSWNTLGSKLYRVRACDDYAVGHCSLWKTCEAKVVPVSGEKCQLTVNIIGNGQVNLSNPITRCSTNSCTYSYDNRSTAIDLSASEGVNWSGDCSGINPSCSLVCNTAQKTVTAVFTPESCRATCESPCQEGVCGNQVGRCVDSCSKEELPIGSCDADAANPAGCSYSCGECENVKKPIFWREVAP